MKEYFGTVCQAEKAPQIIKGSGQIINAFVYDSASAGRLQHGSLVVVAKENNSIFCKVITIKAYEKSVHIVRNGTQEFCVHVTLEPIKETTEDYEGPLRAQLLKGFSLRFPTNEEVRNMQKLPTEGIPLGTVEIAEGRKLPYFFQEEKAYQSTIIVGVQGTGKTSCMKTFATTMAEVSKKKPAIVILDVEGEYLDMPQADVKSICQENRNHYTLSGEDVHPEDLAMFVPQLGGVTADKMTLLAKGAYNKLLADPGKLTMKDILRQIKLNTASQMALNQNVRNALLRACESPNFSMFDEEGAKQLRVHELLEPGKITIVDLSKLEHDSHQRTAALWLLLGLHRIKLHEKNDVPVLLFVDEAHRLFPRQMYGDLKPDYIKRLTGRISEITHRGRKRNYGAVFATQSPNDLAPDIINLCNTKIIMHLAGYSTWIKHQLGSQHVKEIEALKIGEAIIISRGLHEGQKIKLPKFEPLRIIVENKALEREVCQR